MNRFDAVMAGEKVVLAFDFAPDLPDSVTVASVDQVTVAVVRGVDASPLGILVGSAALVGSDVLQMVQPPTAGVEYRMMAWALFSDGQRRAVTGRLEVVAEL